MSQPQSLVALINGDAMRKEFLKALGTPKMIDKFLRLATSTINQTPRLKDCSQESVVGALLKSAQLNLEPNTVLGECYLIPRQNKGKWEANFELGYKGIMKLAYRSGDVKLIQAYDVFENDTFDVDYGENKVIHKPYMKGDRGNVVAYWARYILKDGTQDFKVWSVSDVEAHRDQYSKSARSDYSPWTTAFNQMAKKTAIKDVLRYAPCSVEDYAHAAILDQTVINVSPDRSAGNSLGTTELFRLAAQDETTAAPQIEQKDGTPEDSPYIIDNAMARDAKWKTTFDVLQALIAERIKNGADPVELEVQMGMGFNDCESASLEALNTAINALKKKKA